jgi:hypothetical protein
MSHKSSKPKRFANIQQLLSYHFAEKSVSPEKQQYRERLSYTNIPNLREKGKYGDYGNSKLYTEIECNGGYASGIFIYDENATQSCEHYDAKFFDLKNHRVVELRNMVAFIKLRVSKSEEIIILSNAWAAVPISVIPIHKSSESFEEEFEKAKQQVLQQQEIHSSPKEEIVNHKYGPYNNRAVNLRLELYNRLTHINPKKTYENKELIGRCGAYYYGIGDSGSHCDLTPKEFLTMEKAYVLGLWLNLSKSYNTELEFRRLKETSKSPIKNSMPAIIATDGEMALEAIDFTYVFYDYKASRHILNYASAYVTSIMDENHPSHHLLKVCLALEFVYNFSSSTVYFEPAKLQDFPNLNRLSEPTTRCDESLLQNALRNAPIDDLIRIGRHSVYYKHDELIKSKIPNNPYIKWVFASLMDEHSPIHLWIKENTFKALWNISDRPSLVVSKRKPHPSENSCSVCWERPVKSAIAPCGHLVCCKVCVQYVKRCPVCRGKIESILNVYY